MNRFAWPLVGFVVLVVLLGVGLTLNPRDVPSPLVGKPAPAFTLKQLGDAGKTFSPEEMRGKVWLLNVWASWCVTCRQEHPVLVDFARTQSVPLVGLNYKELRGDAAIDMSRVDAASEEKEARERATRWLAERGDPYALTALDLDGRAVRVPGRAMRQGRRRHRGP